MNDKIKVYVHPDHLLYDELSRVEVDLLLEDQIADIRNHSLFFFTTCQQNALFQKLEKISPDNNVYLDASTYQAVKILESFPQVVGLFNGSFISPKKTIETFCRQSHQRRDLEVFFELMSLKCHQSKFIGTGFIYPRTISMIINEAYFALGEKVAKRSDIDRAMRYGVNYPEGPFEWEKKYQAQSVIRLLNALKEETGDERYNVAPELLKEIN